jgi:hypothetical protein
LSYHVLVRRGDATAEVEAVLRGMGATPERAGLHKVLYVTRAEQTVVMLTGPGSPLARELRGRPGWEEPAQEAGPPGGRPARDS